MDEGVNMRIGLDWDDTVTEYAQGLSKLVECASELHIITLNPDVTEKLAKDVLKFDNHLTVHIMPDNGFDTSAEDVGVGKWKANKCVELGVELMIDDLQSVIDECLKLGVPAIQVQAR